MISLDDETHERLRQYAYEHHMTVSAAIKQWVWSQVVGVGSAAGSVAQSGEEA